MIANPSRGNVELGDVNNDGDLDVVFLSRDPRLGHGSFSIKATPRLFAFVNGLLNLSASIWSLPTLMAMATWTHWPILARGRACG